MNDLEFEKVLRLDQKVVESLPHLSRSAAVKLITDGNVMVNGSIATKSGYKLRTADEVTISYDQEKEEAIPTIDIPIIYEDEDCVVINKPIGLLTHSKGAFNPEATVATWLKEKTKGLEGNRAGIVHRLDRATSGVMICAKNAEALSWLQKQFSQRKSKKSYVAVITGEISPAEAIIDMPIERNPKAPATFRVGAQGKSATTYFQVLKTNNKYSMLELKPETGRTHQLRVHLVYQKHPIVGDTLYGGEPADRLFLHAHTLELTLLKNHERKTFSAPIPPEFNAYVK